MRQEFYRKDENKRPGGTKLSSTILIDSIPYAEQKSKFCVAQ
jgi:hypothetical protein